MEISISKTPVEEINQLHSELNELAKDALTKSIRIGELLTEQRKLCKHGKWLPWLKANTAIPQTTGNNYMRIYANRAKLATVANLTDAYRLVGIKEPKGGRHAPKRHDEHERIATLADAGLNNSEISAQTGISQRTVRRELETEAHRREAAALAEPQVTRDMLSITAQQKFDVVIKQEKARLAADFALAVDKEVKEFLTNSVGPVLAKEQKEARWIMESRKGVMTRKQFNQIRACLHNDRTPSNEEKHNAFVLFTSFEKFMLSEKESPTEFVEVPTNWDEWVAARHKRDRKRSTSNTGSIAK
jgi:hypothetical protein